MTKEEVTGWAFEKLNVGRIKITYISDTKTLYHVRSDFADGDRLDHIERGRWPRIEITDSINGEIVRQEVKEY